MSLGYYTRIPRIQRKSLVWKKLLQNLERRSSHCTPACAEGLHPLWINFLFLSLALRGSVQLHSIRSTVSRVQWSPASQIFWEIWTNVIFFDLSVEQGCSHDYWKFNEGKLLKLDKTHTTCTNMKIIQNIDRFRSYDKFHEDFLRSNFDTLLDRWIGIQENLYLYLIKSYVSDFLIIVRITIRKVTRWHGNYYYVITRQLNEESEDERTIRSIIKKSAGGSCPSYATRPS